ncbi:dehydrogenase domain-containing protein, putative [Babesia ovata]|uniref:Dehydrogenase domain-containing protein, putative n=1 Tax=Babesia ovata TaxID=189622 RepID=A0A2H6KJG4_9APIC|nr:dehydrogenase domain-containing protein, putative [Babesia ovata]GBE63143.1 dehydrogenase domain-containing protein, putative [Babesia ovata]
MRSNSTLQFPQESLHPRRLILLNNPLDLRQLRRDDALQLRELGLLLLREEGVDLVGEGGEGLLDFLCESSSQRLYGLLGLLLRSFEGDDDIFGGLIQG